MKKNNPKTNKLLAAGAAVVTLTGVAASDQAQALTIAGSGNISAVIVNVPTVTEVTVMHFGSVAANALVPGTVALAPVGSARTPAGGATAVVGGGAGVVAASGVLQINGFTSGTTINITATAGPVTITETIGGVATMTVTNFLVAASGTTANAITVTPAATTQLNVGVGATLNVGAAQAVGTYTGTYTVNVQI